MKHILTMFLLLSTAMSIAVWLGLWVWSIETNFLKVHVSCCIAYTCAQVLGYAARDLREPGLLKATHP